MTPSRRSGRGADPAAEIATASKQLDPDQFDTAMLVTTSTDNGTLDQHRGVRAMADGTLDGTSHRQATCDARQFVSPIERDPGFATRPCGPPCVAAA